MHNAPQTLLAHESEIACVNSWRASYEGHRVYFAQVSAPDGWDILTYENRLVEAMESIIDATNNGEADPVCWVHRTALVDDLENDIPTGWMLEGFEAHPVDIETTDTLDTGSMPACDPAFRVLLAWGNGAASRRLFEHDHLTRRVLSGMADAQMLWVQLGGLSSNSGDVIRELEARPSKPKHLSRLTKRAERLSAGVLVQEFLHDQLLSQSEGPRRAVAGAQLSSWGYQELERRVAQRVRNVERVASQVAAQQASRFHRLVEVILLVLGLTSAIQLYLAVVSTSYSETAGGSPDGTLGIMAYVRSSDVDTPLVVLTFILVCVSGFLIWYRERHA
ncbi:hypothetical protein ACHABX_12875 [Nesterenkonia halotolerans]|uniref:hypothetical protein n=1 Tax=Nesterenkonia halotolerans TaxID=225325 RepID=UPI003EE7E913